jgi:dipeptidyl aminopeptidase/acylaminoacyl peptidase
VPSAGGTPGLVSDREVSGFVWSGDGEKLLFRNVSERVTMEVPAKGGDPRDITPKPGGAADGPVYWPDGRSQCSTFTIDPPKFATADELMKGRMSGIGVAPAGGAEHRILIPADTKGLWYSACRLSSDGRRIAYILFDYAKYGKEGMYSIWTMDVNGGSRKQLTLGGEYMLAWSPDGKWIAFEKRIKDMDFELYKIAADGGEPIRMNIKGRSPEFSPDGRRIAYSRRIDSGYEYWLVENALPAQAGKTK